jgi:hypothetical protein
MGERKCRQRSAYFSRSSAAAFLRSYILSTNCFAIDGSERHIDEWHKKRVGKVYTHYVFQL